MLPLPEPLEQLVQKFSVVTAVYSFLLRQHIQVCLPCPVESSTTACGASTRAVACFVIVAPLLSLVCRRITHALLLVTQFHEMAIFLQPSWRAVAAALPSMPGGCDISLADVELMARLAPDVLIVRQDLG